MSSGTAAYSLDPGAQIARVRLIVADLTASIEFYEQVIGLRTIHREEGFAKLAPVGGAVVLELEEQSGVKALRERSRLGIYHFAVLLPNRKALAQFAGHLLERGIHFGSSDHLVSEAFYLVDPDGIHVEVYADRPRDTWLWRGGKAANRS